MSKPKKVKVLCDECGNECEVIFGGKQSIECCPFCGELATVVHTRKPLLNSFDKLEDYDDYEDFEE